MPFGLLVSLKESFVVKQQVLAVFRIEFLSSTMHLKVRCHGAGVEVKI